MTEMTKLREALDAAGIKWKDDSDNRFGLSICRTNIVRPLMHQNGTIKLNETFV